MVESCTCCVAYLNEKSGGTYEIVKYALKKGMYLINIGENGVRCNMKRIISLIFVCVILLSATSCGKLKITDEQAFEIINSLLPSANEINEIFFGKGIEPLDGSEPDDSGNAHYCEVSKSSPYRTIASIKSAAEKVYCSAYLSSVYVSVFSGVSPENEGESVLPALSPRYREIDGVLKINVNSRSYNIYHIKEVSTAKIVGNAKKKVTVLCDCILEDDSAVQMNLYLTTENGRWVFQSPTY